MREERLVRQNEALVRLARSEKLAGGQWLEVLREVTEAAAWALETERTSVWLYDGQRFSSSLRQSVRKWSTTTLQRGRTGRRGLSGILRSPARGAYDRGSRRSKRCSNAGVH